MPPKTRFVLISTARSGTTVVMRTLANHPDVRAHEEIFHRKRSQDDFSADFLARHDLNLRDDDPTRFAYAVLNHGDGKQCVGFKMWPGQEKSTCDTLLRDPNIHKIVLERKNKLGGFTSRELARASGVWHRQSDDKAGNSGMIHFDEAAFRKFVRNQTRRFADVADRAVGPCLFISYSDILAGYFGQIVAFLGLAEQDLSAPLAKINSTHLLDRFVPEDRDQVRAVLDDLGHADWTIER
ncbi:hypothetical protein AB3Y40_17245 [Yoonia sp. R2331]|uniref:hypothetical protein n=1 Tax=Yoonia sp. R2331 TaxID=3237238 RepID=UPI0034E3C7E1